MNEDYNIMVMVKNGHKYVFIFSDDQIIDWSKQMKSMIQRKNLNFNQQDAEYLLLKYEEQNPIYPEF